MEIQAYQLISLLLWIGLGVMIWKINHGWTRVILLLIGLIAFAFSPIRHKQEGVASIERVAPVSEFSDIPEKVVVEQPEFSDRQQQELNQLKNYSESIQDEVHN